MSEDQVRVSFRTLGCKVNRVESEDIAADLLGRGVALSADDDADVVVINTCTVTAEADAKARKTVRHALAAPGRPVVVVTGCLAAVDPMALEALGERVVVEPDKERVAGRVAEFLGIDPNAPHSHVVRAGEGFRTRAMLKVEDGCDVFCSYCIVPHARGGPRGVPLAAAVSEARALVEHGVKEIVLTGINLGRYRDGSDDLASLVSAVGETGVPRLRLSSIEPPDLTEQLLETLAATPALCRHLHVPLQSGSDSVLSAMRRNYTVDEYRALVSAAKDALPGLSVTTDVMVGFPGETEEDAEQTRALCEEIGFAKLHVFRYSVRPGTPAAEMAQIDPRAKASRAARLRQTGDSLRAQFLQGHAGASAEVLLERERPPDVFEGTTRDYVKVRLQRLHPALAEDDAELGVGDVVEVMLGEPYGDGLEGWLPAARNAE
ncbi:MAG TPA: tRNA (N(6)-L-threonylcarbamoyladenosine(37)-C(2))-methylthiotransferase MtaB [Coriobacteriia bacterium]|nr:tRNA (N(6)-L-threonylcarbamoyladenosine(37)-C(2))-methylthiotransferase MtaB [Coriobacteriia bacterium]